MNVIVAAIASAKHGEPQIDIDDFRRWGGIGGGAANAQAIWNIIKKKASHHIAAPIAAIDQKKFVTSSQRR